MFAIALLAVLVPFGVSACSSPSVRPTPAHSEPPPAPIYVDLDTAADGTSVSIPLHDTADLITKSGDITAWTGEAQDPSILKFVRGRNNGSAIFNAGLQPLATGTTNVTLTNSATGTVVTLSVTVTP